MTRSMIRNGASTARDARMQLIVFDPGHFHASLLQKEMYPGLSRQVEVFAPLGPEVLDYLSRVAACNNRSENPTAWELDIHLGPHPLADMLRARRGDIVVFTGRNRGKIDRIRAALEAGLHVLADKPWIIASGDLPKLERALQLAERNHLAAYDIMTERYEVTSELQRVFVNDAEVFGRLETGGAEDPGVSARSVHHVMKVVAGAPLRRPAWFFDIGEYGEGLADVGTHVVDLAQWTAFPDTAIDYPKDIQLIDGRRWPLTLTRDRYKQVTGESRGSDLDYYCNNSVHYTLRGVHVKLEILWMWEAPEGSGDIYEATFRGGKARVEIRQGESEKRVPELYIVPVADGLRDEVFAAARKRVAALQTQWPGLAIVEGSTEARIAIPDKFRVGHEAHFAQVTRRFFEYVQAPQSLPGWETANMLAKYHVSTRGTELGRR